MKYFLIILTSRAATLVMSAGFCETQRSPCVEGCYYVSATGQCAEVPAGYYSPTDDNNLYACPPGAASWFPGSGSCFECGIGEYAANPGSTACSSCNPKYYFGPGSTNVVLENGELYCQPRIETIMPSVSPSHARFTDFPSFFSSKAPFLPMTSGSPSISFAAFQPVNQPSVSPVQISSKPSATLPSSKPFFNPSPSKAPAFRNSTDAPSSNVLQHPVLPNFWPRSSPPTKSNSSIALKEEKQLNRPMQNENEAMGTLLQYLPFMITAFLLVCIGCMYRRVKPKKTRYARAIPPPPPNSQVL